MQTSLNLALGSAMASIGLTIPAIAIASIWLDGPLELGLGATQMVLLATTVIVGVLTVVPGRATLQQGGVHLVLFGAFLFLAASPGPIPSPVGWPRSPTSSPVSPCPISTPATTDTHGSSGDRRTFASGTRAPHSQGVGHEPIETYSNGVRHVNVPDPDGNAIALAERPEAAR